ncbi:MAG: pur operon repressor [Streptococcaceae bacterium]|jgi:purine operon repressor|nr:pur operon repressor [Streptococcaceae bacterium]
MRRSERLVDLTHYLLENPYQLINLKFFVARYESSKSTISEDLEIVRAIFERQNIGSLATFPGASGGLKFTPAISNTQALVLAKDILRLMAEEDRILPGGYLYLSDILGTPEHLKKIGQILAHEFADSRVDAVMTIATKGIPIAQMVAEILNVPFAVVRRDPKVTEGAMINVNYMSGSSSKVENMTVSKRAFSIGQRVLIVDDFMKGGGTLNGMKALVEELDCRVAGVGVFVEGPFHGSRPLTDYRSILRVDKIDLANHTIDAEFGNIFEEKLF